MTPAEMIVNGEYTVVPCTVLRIEGRTESCTRIHTRAPTITHQLVIHLLIHRSFFY